MGDGERTGMHDLNMASRKAEEAAWRRYQAVKWIESLVGPVGFSSRPSEREFISRLRNGLILCNAINKIQPQAVPKVVVVENHSPLQSITRESQPLPAYQYFENVRNFLVAVEELKLPAFEASDLERDTLELGSVSKVVDCILALKSYHEWKQTNGGNGFYKHVRSPMVMHSTSSKRSQPLAVISSDSRRRLDMSPTPEKPLPAVGGHQKFEDLIAKVLAEHMADGKENIDENFLVAFSNQNLMKFEDCLKEEHGSPAHTTSIPVEDRSLLGDSKCCGACLRKGNCNHRQLFQMQEKELQDLRSLLSTTKREFADLQSQLETDLRELSSQVEEMSTAAQGYHKVVTENRYLYNMVQDLKGNIRVYCRIRPAFNAEARNAIEYIGDDGSLVILDPSKPQKDGRKVFQFNRVFGPLATQGEVYTDTQPLIRSVMDGYNVCIFAYGQTGSGKTYTMSGPSGGSAEDMGINYLALNDLFKMSNIREDNISYDIQVQMVEIYNEQVRDLLAEDSSTTKLEIRSCTSDNGLSLPDATIHSVKSTTDVLNLMKLGEVNRLVSSTAMNNRSSRSHSVLTVHVQGEDTSGGIIRSCLHLVDLAGSERVDKSEVTGDRLKEAQHINKSLSCLGDVITALAQKNSHIPYRNSKLTLLLQDSLGGHAKTLMFAHVSPEGDSFGETVCTLKFAQRVSTVELGAARANKESSEVMRLKEQIESLKKALADKEAQSAQFGKMKELRSPREKPKVMIDRTPPRARRLSIENCSTTKNVKPKAMTALTPPHVCRLSTENCSTTKTVKPMNSDCGKVLKTSTIPARDRRLSLEGPRYGPKDNVSRSISKPSENSNNGSSMMEIYHPRTPLSPTTIPNQIDVLRTDGKTRIPTLQLPKTPERQAHATNDVEIVMHSELTISANSRKGKLISSTNGKGSQIRKSLRTIGKLISGSEKRNQQNERQADPPVSETNNPKSRTVTANARAMRRQSLTGIQSSRRSSLGGKPLDSDADDSRRNAKTPPPVCSSTKMAKPWM
ncbi:kinesin-like protein KIN-14L isoform X1 [Tripterygium wilfordii]|uniref:kinesin-like protein KIN-14L isoform X1 n=1 Tax=Tripterygium wilfordii TaxID=458696 RepID=UPI0018F85820|nr:kinesin-like protein KIN-14L isoform X1 [Tripterygium wilfordii]XP_038720145.1 kinesin-like protein KIN-14L isoform X1 [Tripterygium wilfordii]